MGHSGIYILIHFYDSTMKYIWSIGNKINDGHKAVAGLTLNNLLFDASLLLLHDATSFSAIAHAQSRRVKRKWQPLSSWHHEPHGVACFQLNRGVSPLLLSTPARPEEPSRVSVWMEPCEVLSDGGRHPLLPFIVFSLSFCCVFFCTCSQAIWLMSADGRQIKNGARDGALTSNSFENLWASGPEVPTIYSIPELIAGKVCWGLH